MSFLDDFKRELKNSPLGRALTDREVEERAEQYRIFIKPLFEKLESIESNTAEFTKQGVSGLPVSTALSSGSTYSNFRVSIQRKFLLFAGLTRNQQQRIDYSISGGQFAAGVSMISVRVGNPSNPSFNVWPGMVLEMPKIGTDIYITTSVAIAARYWQFFESDHQEVLKGDPIPFKVQGNSTPAPIEEGIISRASLDPTGDQYVLFRNTPTVILGAGTAQAGLFTPTATKTIVRTSISFAGVGNNTLVGAAGAGLKIKVLGLFLFAGAANNVIIQSGAGGTSLIGQINLAANQGFVLPIRSTDGEHWIETAANTLLNANASAASQTSGVVVHINEA